jgi:hypothetical protein
LKKKKKKSKKNKSKKNKSKKKKANEDVDLVGEARALQAAEAGLSESEYSESGPSESEYSESDSGGLFSPAEPVAGRSCSDLGSNSNYTIG